jgi:hypothetical protein
MKGLTSILVFIFLVGLLLSCDFEKESVPPYPCIDGNCDAEFMIDPLVSPGVFQDSNQYWHIKFWGPKYFTIMGRLDELDPKYVLNKIPLIETHYDSDYWIVFNSISFKIPIYSVLSWFTDKSYKTPISVGNLVINLTDLAKLQSPLNIAGYQINKNFCWDCPYAWRLLGSYSKYTYNPRQQFFLDKDMVGDTLKVMVKSTFNTDVGTNVVVEKEFNIVIDK